jgi:uncharacterized protein YbaR (Trm112 family)
MPAQFANDPDFDRVALDSLACPACHGDLLLDGARLVCVVCGLVYAIRSGIPSLIPGRAEDPAESSAQ